MRNFVLLLAVCSCFAVTNDASAGKRTAIEFLNSGKVVPTSLPFSEAVRVNDTLYLSGQIGIVPGTLKLVPGGINVDVHPELTHLGV